MSSRQSTVYSPAYGKSNNLLKKIPQNPKYKNVKPVIDSGSNIRKYLEAVQEAQKNINYKKDECFKRIKLSAFVKLVIEVFNEISDDSYSEEPFENHSSFEQPKEVNAVEAEAKSTKSLPLSESAFSRVVFGIGEMDLQNVQNGVEESSPVSCPEDRLNTLPYLLLDVRDKDDFMACNIISARSYPYPMLSRAYTYETKNLLKYKNIPHKLIIVYDEDELIASRVATTLVQRGYDNVYMLSGGLKLALEKFPKGLVNGSMPTRLRVSRSSEARSAQSVEYFTPPVCPASSGHTLKKFFSQDDIALLQEFLDKHGSSATGVRAKSSLSWSYSSMPHADRGITATRPRSQAGVKSAPSKSRPPWK